MNNKGQNTLFFSIIVGVLIFLIGVIFVNFITPEVTNARNVDNLDCTNSSISDGTKLGCLVVDIAVPYYIITIISMAGGIITSRFLIGR